MSSREPAGGDVGEIAVDRRFRRDQDVVTRQVAGETLVVPIRRRVGDLEALYTLNETGTFLWDLVDGERTVAGLAAALHGEYEVTADEAAAHVREFLSGLLAAGLISPAAEQG